MSNQHKSNVDVCKYVSNNVLILIIYKVKLFFSSVTHLAELALAPVTFPVGTFVTFSSEIQLNKVGFGALYKLMKVFKKNNLDTRQFTENFKMKTLVK